MTDSAPTTRSFGPMPMKISATLKGNPKSCSTTRNRPSTRISCKMTMELITSFSKPKASRKKASANIWPKTCTIRQNGNCCPARSKIQTKRWKVPACSNGLKEIGY